MSSLIPTRTADVATEVIDGEVLLYEPRQARAVHLNATAAIVWGLCDGVRSVQEIIRLVAESYPEGGTGLSEDVPAALKQLEENGVLVVRTDAG